MSSSADSGRTSLIDVVPLGGVGEFGMNMMAVTSADTTVVLDAGAMFPGPEHLGIDLIVPDLTYLESRPRVDGLVLTHGHEDHIGGVPYVWDMLDGPVYGTPLTLALLAPKLQEHAIDATDRLVSVTPGERVRIGSFEVEFLRVTHSMPDCVAVALHSSVGTIVHTGDFKIDDSPLDGMAFDRRRFAELGDDGVLALFADSTNVSRPGHTGSEQDVLGGFEEIFTTAGGRLVVATFASSLYRIQLLVDLAARFGRKVALIGRSLQQNATIGQRLGHLRIPADLLIRDRDVDQYPRDQVLCLVTGSQGEPRAALSRIAVDAHRHVHLEPGDVVVFSARAIPGNQRAIGRLMNHVVRRGAQVIDEDVTRVHVSGHGSQADLALMLSLVRPRYFVPIHGEYRYLVEHARLAERVTNGNTTVLVAENGDCLGFDTEDGWIGGRVPAGRVLVDGPTTGEVVDEVLRDRRHLAADGVVVLVLAVNQHDGTLAGDPTVTTRGLATDARTEALLREVPSIIRASIEDASIEERADPGLLQEQVRGDLQRFFRKRVGRRPLILPVVLEI